MAYIGPAPKLGQNREVDDISSGFNGSTTAFTLQVSGSNVSPGSATSIIVSVNNVIQNPNTDYTINGSTITFTSAPTNGQSFFAVVLNQGVDTSTPTDGSVTTVKLSNDAVTGAKIADNVVTTDHIINSAITSAKIAAGTIVTADIADHQITDSKLASNSVTTARINGSAVTTAKIGDDAVTGAKIADDSINSEHYVDGSIDTAHIADSQITSAKIADGTIATGDIADDAVTSAKLGAGAVDTTALGADAVTAAKIADDAVNSTHLDTNAVTTDSLGANVVTTAKIADDAITAAKLNANSVVNAALDTVAQNRIKGRVSSGTGNVEDLTAAQVRTMINVANGATAGGGKVVQVVINQKTAKFATSSTSYVDVTGFDAVITPSSSSNKILVITSANFGAGQDGQNNFARLLRGSTNLFTNDQSIRMPNAYIVNTFVHIILDSPNTTSSTTYKYQVKAESNEVFLNRGGSNVTRGQSTILLIELDYT
tara:strand:+ start:150 stop:1604 length:1455 start_codon:yes stop_codon:yes gene_type:complete